MHKESFIINHNTLLHVSTLLVHLQGELFVALQCRPGPQRVHASKNNAIYNQQHISLNYKVQP
jgi:hypothetical protein